MPHSELFVAAYEFKAGELPFVVLIASELTSYYTVVALRMRPASNNFHLTLTSAPFKLTHTY